MNRRHIRLRDGTVRDLIPGEVIPDGATLIVPAFMRDSDPDQERAEAHEARKADIQSAWQHPSQQQDVPQPAATREDAHREMVTRLANAWQVPVRSTP